MNKVTLIGNVGQEPAVKEFPQGGMVANLTLATTHRGYTTKDGKKIEDVTYWHNLVVGGGLAKVVKSYVHKGDKLAIEGELTYRSYDGKDGQKKFITEIRVNEMEMLTAKTDNQPSAKAMALAKELGAEPMPNDGLPF